jgi:hypothetical protein
LHTTPTDPKEKRAPSPFSFSVTNTPVFSYTTPATATAVAAANSAARYPSLKGTVTPVTVLSHGFGHSRPSPGCFVVDGVYSELSSAQDDIEVVLKQQGSIDFAALDAAAADNNNKLFSMFGTATTVLSRLSDNGDVTTEPTRLWVDDKREEFYMMFDAHYYTTQQDKRLKLAFAEYGIFRVFTQSDVAWRLDATIHDSALESARLYVLKRVWKQLEGDGLDMPAIEATIVDRRFVIMVTEKKTSNKTPFDHFMDAKGDRDGTHEFNHPSLSKTLVTQLRAIVATTAHTEYQAKKNKLASYVGVDEALVKSNGAFSSTDERWNKFIEQGVNFTPEQRARLVERVHELYDAELVSAYKLPLDEIDKALHARNALYYRAAYMPRRGDILWHGTHVAVVSGDETIEMRNESFFSTDMRMSVAYASDGMLLHRLERDLPERTVNLVRLSSLSPQIPRGAQPFEDNIVVRLRRGKDTTTHDLLAKVWGRMFGYSWSRFTGAAQVVCRVWNTAMLVHMLQPEGSELGDYGLEVILCEPRGYLSKRLASHLLSGLHGYSGFFHSNPLHPWQNTLIMAFGFLAVDAFRRYGQDYVPQTRRSISWGELRGANTVLCSAAYRTPVPLAIRLATRDDNSFYEDSLRTLADSAPVEVVDVYELDTQLRNVLTRHASSPTKAWYNIDTLVSVWNVITMDYYEKPFEKLVDPGLMSDEQQAFLKQLHENITTHPGLLISKRAYPALVPSRAERRTAVCYDNNGPQPSYGMYLF